MGTLFLIVVLDLVGFGMIIPVFPFAAERVGVDPAAVIFFLGLYSLGQLVGAPVWGGLSDRIGRRPVLLATLLANAAANWLLAFSHDPWSLAISRIVSGLAAGNMAAAFAYATDITGESDRPKALGRLGAAFGIGFIIGPAFGGLLAGDDPAGSAGLTRVAHGAAILSLVACALTWFRLPESHPPERRGVRRAARPSARSYLARPALRALLVSSVIIMIGVAMMQSTLALWTADALRVTPRQLGWIYGYIGVISAVVQGGLTAPLTQRFGPAALLRTGTLLAGVGLAVVPFSGSVVALLVWLTFIGIGTALQNPSYAQLFAAASNPDERGAVLGAYQGSASLGRVIGPFTASGIATLAPLSWPFLVAAVLMGIALVVLRDLGALRAAPAVQPAT